MPKLKWLGSYETLKFNTPNGDLGKGQYAIYQGRHYVRYPQDSPRWTILEALDNHTLNIPKIIAGLEQVLVVEDEKMYYDEFELPSKKTIRIPINKQEYLDLAKKDVGQREKNLSNAEIIELEKGVN